MLLVKRPLLARGKLSLRSPQLVTTDMLQTVGDLLGLRETESCLPVFWNMQPDKSFPKPKKYVLPLSILAGSSRL